MGKKSEFTSRLLIAIDVSGSISDEELNLFYSAINRFFVYGMQSVEVIQFDTEIKGKPVEFKKSHKTIHISGRGGTNFQPAIDFFTTAKNPYDGLIIFTDGFAPPPEIVSALKRKVLWICSNKKNYEHHHGWINQRGRGCWIE
jgi:predicted metal-dependent peptidase